MAKNPSEWIEHFDIVIGDLHSEAEALLDAVSSSETGEWTAEQKDRYDEIMGPQGKENEGLIAAADADRHRWVDTQAKVDKSKANRASERERAVVMSRQEHNIQSPQGQFHMGGGGIYALGSSRPIAVPPSARAHRTLSNVWGNNEYEREANAYASSHYLAAALFAWEPSLKFLDRHGIELVKDQQSIGTDGKGGYLVPTELERTIIKIREQYGIMRAHARNFTMSSETLDLPKDMNGIVVAPAAELSDLKANNETTKDWTRPQLIARKWAGYTYWSNELDEDAIIDIGTDIAMDYGRAFAYAEDNSGFNGDGQAGFNSITGIRNALLASSTVVSPVNAAPTPGDLTIDLFTDMIGKTPNTEMSQQAWYCHKSVWAQGILPLTQPVTAGNTIRDIEAGAQQNPGGTGRQPNFYFEGYPGYFVNTMPTSGDFAADLPGAVVFGDLNAGIAFGDRRGVSVALSSHAEFINDALALRGTERFDIIVHEIGTATATDPAGVIVMLTLGAAA